MKQFFKNRYRGLLAPLNAGQSAVGYLISHSKVLFISIIAKLSGTIIVLGIILSLHLCSFAAEQQTVLNSKLSVSDVQTFSENNYFGLKDKDGNIVVKPEFVKLIRVGNSSWIVQKRNKFGLIDSNGNYILKAKYRHVERVLGKFVKFGNDNDYALYDEYGNIILEPVYTSIDLLYGGMFLTYKNYKYGVSDFNGKVLIDNVCEDIYMPKRNIMRIKYNGDWYEIEQVSAETLTLPSDITTIRQNKAFKVTDLVTDTGVISGYSVLTFSDYLIKIFSSISPAHEAAIDDLMLSKGADTVGIFMRLGWLPKYPFTFAKKYYANIRNPINGPLSDIRSDLIKQMSK